MGKSSRTPGGSSRAGWSSASHRTPAPSSAPNAPLREKCVPSQWMASPSPTIKMITITITIYGALTVCRTIRQYAKYLACIISVNPHQHPVNRYLNTYLKLARLRVREVVFCPRSHGKIQRQIFGASSPEPAQEWGWGCSSGNWGWGSHCRYVGESKWPESLIVSHQGDLWRAQNQRLRDRQV